MTYYYDWFVRPQMMVVSVGKIVEMKQTYPNSLADKYGISMEQILNKKPMSMSKTKLTAQIDSLETSFQADIDTCGLLLSILPDTLASKAYDSYRLREIGVVYQDAVHPVANEDSLRLVAHTELYKHAIGAWETSNELRRHRLEYFGRTLNTGYIYIAYILFAFLGYLLRFKPIKKILAVFAILIVAAWIYHEINSIVQEYAKKLNTESHQIVDDTYKEIDAIRESKQREMKTDTQLE
jgi:thiaminase